MQRNLKRYDKDTQGPCVHHVDIMTYAPSLLPSPLCPPALTFPIARPHLKLPQGKQSVLVTNTTRGTRLRLSPKPCMGGS